MEEEDKIKYYLGLNMIEGLGPVRIQKLLAYFNSPKEAFYGRYEDFLKVENIGKELAEKIIKEREKKDPLAEIKKIKENNIQIITHEDPEYPFNLKALYDAPVVLYVKGKLLYRELSIAVVGTRHPTEYGILQARHLSKQLAALGFCIVSGLAKGIDAAAHKAVLELEKDSARTIGVLGCGIDVIYPKENKYLYEKIPKSGALITEFPFGTKPLRQNFPRRNRIISGLSLGVVVVEAPLRSGALITASYALHQNREVFAVPGPVNKPTFQGVNNLIKQGAKLVSSVKDILEELYFIIKEDIKKGPILSPSEEDVYELIKYEPIDIETLSVLSNKELGKLSIILLNLETKGLIRGLIGKRFVRV